MQERILARLGALIFILNITMLYNCVLCKIHVDGVEMDVKNVINDKRI